MAAYWEIAAHSAYDVFSKYKSLIVNLVFHTSVLWNSWMPYFKCLNDDFGLGGKKIVFFE